MVNERGSGTGSGTGTGSGRGSGTGAGRGSGTGPGTVQQAGTAGKCMCKFPRQTRTSQGKGTITRLLNKEYMTMENGVRYKRAHVCGSNPNPWTAAEGAPAPRPKTPPQDKSLWVIRQHQEGKGPHWSLFSAFDDDTDNPKGRIWQVNGDPDVGMHHVFTPPDKPIAIFSSGSFGDATLVCNKSLSKESERKLNNIAATTKPPPPPTRPGRQQAPSQPQTAAPCDECSRGNCRTWVWQVLDELVKEGIVTQVNATKAKKLRPLSPRR